MGRGAEAIAGTESGVAATQLTLAERALREARLQDAQGLLSEAAAALRAVEHERLRAERWPGDPTPDPTAAAGAGQRRTAADRALDDAARRRERAAHHRHEAALRRETAAQLRDEVAAERDRQAAERAVAAERREAAADERRAEHRRWTGPPTASAGGRPPGEGEEQRAIDIEVEASYRGWIEDDRARAAGDRAADTADRRAAEQDRLAAQQDREAARADREQDSRDQAAATADRERRDGR
ncbi:hypothetical protein [Geodermatophilus sp. SYSU D00698]